MDAASLDDPVRRARRRAAADTPAQVIMAPMGLNWLSLASYWSQQG